MGNVTGRTCASIFSSDAEIKDKEKDRPEAAVGGELGVCGVEGACSCAHALARHLAAADG
jgi:hypothetical protein